MAVQIVEQSVEGSYGMWPHRVLAVDEASGLGVLIEDSWSGVGNLEGECYRPRLHCLTARQVAHVRAYWDRPWDDGWYAWPFGEPHSVRYYGEAEPALRRHIKRQARRHPVT